MLSQQYDGLKIQLSAGAPEASDRPRERASGTSSCSARASLRVGRDRRRGLHDRRHEPRSPAAAEHHPQSLLNRASIMLQLEQENGAKVSLLAAAEARRPARARRPPPGAAARADQLAAAMAAKVAVIQKKENFFNSAAFAQADGHLPADRQLPHHHPVTADTIGAQALRWALIPASATRTSGARPGRTRSTAPAWSCGPTRRSASACRTSPATSGTWASTSRGASFSPATWCSSTPTSSHVGLYVGNGLMVDAPDLRPERADPAGPWRSTSARSASSNSTAETAAAWQIHLEARARAGPARSRRGPGRWLSRGGPAGTGSSPGWSRR